MELFKFTSFLSDSERLITCAEKIIQFEMTNSSSPTFTVESLPVKAVRHISSFHRFRYLGVNSSTYVQKQSKISSGVMA